MTTARADIWRQRLWVWAIALAFLLVNCLGLLVYHFGYANRVTTLQLDVRNQSAKLADAVAERQRLEGLLRLARVNRERVFQLYDEHFSTRRRRLTGVTAEVKSLATRAGMRPRSITYPEEQIQQYGLVKRSFNFNVEGTYTDLRKFINLLELSDSFLTLEGATLNEEGGRPGGGPKTGYPAVLAAGAPPMAPGMTAAGALRIGLTISTLFGTQEEPKDALAPLPGAAANTAGAPHGRTP